MSALPETLGRYDTETLRDGASSEEFRRWGEHVVDEELLRPLQRAEVLGAPLLANSTEVTFLTQ